MVLKFEWNTNCIQSLLLVLSSVESLTSFTVVHPYPWHISHDFLEDVCAFLFLNGWLLKEKLRNVLFHYCPQSDQRPGKNCLDQNLLRIFNFPQQAANSFKYPVKLPIQNQLIYWGSDKCKINILLTNSKTRVCQAGDGSPRCLLHCPFHLCWNFFFRTSFLKTFKNLSLT